jgi:hypothetical protein
MPHAYYGTNAMLRELAEPVAPAILDLVGPDSPVPCVVQLNHLGGALSRPPSVPNAVAHREAAYLVRVLAVLDGPGPSPARSAPTRLTDALREWTLGRSPNFVFGERVFGAQQGEAERSGAEQSRVEQGEAERSGAELVRDCYAAADLPRLAELKAAVDPANLFRCNLNIPPATRRSPRPGTPPAGRA